MPSNLKLTPAIIASIVALVEEGQWPEIAARSLGLSAGLVTSWLDAGKQEFLTGEKSSGDPRSYRRKLYEQVTAAEARYEVAIVQAMTQRVKESKYFQGYMAILARRFPERWGERREISGPARTYEEMLRQWEAERNAGRADQPA